MSIIRKKARCGELRSIWKPRAQFCEFARDSKNGWPNWYGTRKSYPRRVTRHPEDAKLVSHLLTRGKVARGIHVANTASGHFFVHSAARKSRLLAIFSHAPLLAVFYCSKKVAISSLLLKGSLLAHFLVSESFLGVLAAAKIGRKKKPIDSFITPNAPLFWAETTYGNRPKQRS